MILRIMGRIVEAELTTEHAASSHGIPVLIIEGEARGTAECAGIEITKATEDEVRALAPAGYWHLALRYLRREAGLTQRRAADLLGVDPMTVSCWERGAHTPSALAREAALARLAAAAQAD